MRRVKQPLFDIILPEKPKQEPPSIPVTIKETGQQGYVWDGRPLMEQIARGRVGVIVDGWTGPMPYYRPDELEALPNEAESEDEYVSTPIQPVEFV